MRNQLMYETKTDAKVRGFLAHSKKNARFLSELLRQGRQSGGRSWVPLILLPKPNKKGSRFDSRFFLSQKKIKDQSLRLCDHREFMIIFRTV